MHSSGVFVIAEAGVNHNGQIELAFRLVDAAKRAGADAVKFQTFVTDELVTRGADMAAYQKANLGGGEHSQFDMLKQLELSYDEFRALQAYCGEVGIEFLSTPDEERSLDFLADDLRVSRIKVGSGDLDNLPFLKLVAQKQRPIILSTGMSTLEEVGAAVETIRKINKHTLTLLHCTSSYPCPVEDVNLRAMTTLSRAFEDVEIGYSDHTVGVEISVAAVALGARVIEKHFTLDKGMRGPDHSASLDPEEFAHMVALVRKVESALGDGIKKPAAAEIETKKNVCKRVVAGRALSEGTRLALSDFKFKRAQAGISVSRVDTLVGRVLTRDLSEDSPIDGSMVKDQ
jgi:N,N'-diacetyllegionaminate synthase